MLEIIPSILAKTPDEFEGLVGKIAPHVERAVVDVGDGVFVPARTVSNPEELIRPDPSLQPRPLRFDVHLMVQDPLAWLERPWPEQADRFLAHVEALGGWSQDDQAAKFIEKLHSQNRKAGLALNPETPLESVESHLSPGSSLGQVDLVQFMTVQPGAYGAEFLPEVLKKVSEFHRRHPAVPIAVDGGLTPETVSRAVKAGASILVVGSYVMMSENPAAALREIKDSINFYV